MTNNETKFLNFVCSFDKYDSEADFLFHFQIFLINELYSNPLIVFSEGKSFQNFDSIWRVSWQYNSKKMESHIKTYQETAKGNFGKKQIIYNDLFFYVFTLKHYKNQIKYLVFSSKKNLGYTMISYIERFLNSAYKNILKFQAISGPQDLAYIDDVTGLFNQRKLHKDLDKSIKNFHNYNISFYVFFLDIDYFKNINDQYGHLTGTKILLHMSNLFKATLRENDLIYRYGGDEFVIIIPNINLHTAMSIGNRILHQVKSRSFASFGDGHNKSFEISISIGLAAFPNDAKTKSDIINIADRMMYKAKNYGRGQIYCTANL